MACRVMTILRKCGFAFLLSLMVCCSGFGNRDARAQDPVGQTAPEENASKEAGTPPPECRELAAMFQQQRGLISRETGQLKREIAALREDLSKPGLREIFAGIGYIFGLAGIALYIQSRRTARK
jgi:hypothetical protein